MMPPRFSGSNSVDNAVEPTRSQNITVSLPASAGAGIGEGGKASTGVWVVPLERLPPHSPQNLCRGWIELPTISARNVHRHAASEAKLFAGRNVGPSNRSILRLRGLPIVARCRPAMSAHVTSCLVWRRVLQNETQHGRQHANRPLRSAPDAVDGSPPGIGVP
jgi:hypothetical protein